MIWAAYKGKSLIFNSMYVIQAINGTLLLFNFVMMQLFRFSYTGRVCSGDYLPDKKNVPEIE